MRKNKVALTPVRSESDDSLFLYLYTRHTSSCRCVGCARSPQSLTGVSSRGFSPLPPACNSKYLG
ncbi:hypothetical protein A8A57_22195 [Lelliottia amnigena]|nr:hypothetical protein A8A57_22195 [Lelliottia amnigena]